MNRLTTLLAGRPALIDGGYGWLLQERGLPAGACAEVWNVEQPERIEELHDEFAVAGAQILTTNSFGAIEPRLAMHGLSGRARELAAAAAAIARRVADRHGILVAGDLGPTGELLEPLGTLGEAEAQALFAETAAGLVEGGADLFLIETMSSLEEARAAIAACREVAPDLPIIATMSFDTNLRTMMGVAPAAAMTALAEAGADAVGANCGRGPDEMLQIVAGLLSARPEGKLVVAQSNAGLPQLHGADFVYTVGPDAMAAHARDLSDLGVDVIGGCCGSSPEHIRAMAEALGVPAAH